MAAAYYNHFVGGGSISAGTQPAESVYLEVVDVMKEEGIDLTSIKPQLLTPEIAAQADLLITMGCGESCPCLPELKLEDWPLPDPKGKSVAEVRRIRDEIKNKVVELIERMDTTTSVK